MRWDGSNFVDLFFRVIMKLNKTQQKKLMALAKRALTFRRCNKFGYEQKVWDEINAYCESIGLKDSAGYMVDAGEVIEQAKVWLRKNSIAAAMNGLV